MIDPNELWVGDPLQVKSSGLVGKYESHTDSMIIINCKGNRITAAIHDVKIYKAPKKEVALHFEDDINNNKSITHDDTIDLHINKLAPHMEHQAQARILDYQIERAKSFVEHSIQNKRYRVLIIHGKGSGVLKAEVNDMLKDFSKVRYLSVIELKISS